MWEVMRASQMAARTLQKLLASIHSLLFLHHESSLPLYYFTRLRFLLLRTPLTSFTPSTFAFYIPPYCPSLLSPLLPYPSVHPALSSLTSPLSLSLSPRTQSITVNSTGTRGRQVHAGLSKHTHIILLLYALVDIFPFSQEV